MVMSTPALGLLALTMTQGRASMIASGVIPARSS